MTGVLVQVILLGIGITSLFWFVWLWHKYSSLFANDNIATVGKSNRPVLNKWVTCSNERIAIQLWEHLRDETR